MYGIDWDGPISEDNSETIQVPEIPCPLADNHLQDLRANINPLRNSLSHGVDIYLETVEFIEERTRNNTSCNVQTRNPGSIPITETNYMPPGSGSGVDLNTTTPRTQFSAMVLEDQPPGFPPGHPPAAYFGQ